jgi:hypothetical protein
MSGETREIRCPECGEAVASGDRCCGVRRLPPLWDKSTPAQARSYTRDVRGSDPIDTLARRVVAPAQEKAVERPLLPHESATPMLTIPWRGRGCRREDDLTGLRWGLLRVIGYAGDPARWNAGGKPVTRSRNRARWVIKCDCGTYLYMRTRTIKRAPRGACSRCLAKGLGLKK